MYATSKNSSIQTVNYMNEYITYKAQNQGENIINSMFKFVTFAKDVKFIQPFTENVITTIKLSDTVVVVGTDVNLFILLLKLCHAIKMFSRVTLELVSDHKYLTIPVFYAN